jgi:hypothetical protein
MIARTTGCFRYAHPEFSVSYDPSVVIQPDVDWLVRTLETAVASGQRFEDGQLFQVGWIVTLIRRNADATLSLLEPRPHVSPIQWQESVDLTLVHCRLQKDVADSVGLLDSISFPSLRLGCIACTRYGSAEGLLLDRTSTTSADDSGWYLGCDDETHDHQDPSNLLCVSLWEAVVKDGRAIPYLALPPGILVHLGPQVPEVVLNDRQLFFTPGSYLHAKYLHKPHFGA